MHSSTAGITCLLISQILACLNVFGSLGFFFVLLLDQLLAESLPMAILLLFSTCASALAVPAINLRKPWMFVPQLITTVLMQILAIVLIMCAISELDGQDTILRQYKPYEGLWKAIGADAIIGCLCVWTLLFLLGNFVTIVHFRTFAHLRKSVSCSRDFPSTSHPIRIYTLQAIERPSGAPPSYDETIRKAQLSV